MKSKWKCPAAVLFNNHYDVPIKTPTQRYQINQSCLNFVSWRPKQEFIGRLLYFIELLSGQIAPGSRGPLTDSLDLHKVSLCPPLKLLSYFSTEICVKQLHISNLITVKDRLVMQLKRKERYPGPLPPIRAESSIKRRSRLLVNTRGVGSCLLLSLPIISACSCGDAERTANSETDRKLAKMSL